MKGFLENTSEKTKEEFNFYGIKNKNEITYIDKETKYKITIQENKIIILRDNEEYSHQMTFELDKTFNTEYYIKKLHSSLTIPIETKNLKITDDYLEIVYMIKTNDNIYKYVLEVEK